MELESLNEILSSQLALVSNAIFMLMYITLGLGFIFKDQNPFWVAIFFSVTSIILACFSKYTTLIVFIMPSLTLGIILFFTLAIITKIAQKYMEPRNTQSNEARLLE